MGFGEISTDWVELAAGAPDVGAAVRFVEDEGAGGVDVFLGTTRAETHAELGVLTHLEYSAYEEMAAAEIRRLVDAARERWPVRRAAVLHRLGACPVGEVSVVIAVSCPHRAEAFAACRFLIDELKRTVPIWKKNVYVGGAEWRGESSS